MVLLLALALAASSASDLESARDRQDRAALERMTAETGSIAQKQSADAAVLARHAQAASYLAEVALELRDKNLARTAAEDGIRSARRAVELNPNQAEYRRILGTLCGQVIPANVLAGLQYGKCAREEIEKGISLNPRDALSYVSRGVGNYYLPASFGGGIDKAISDFRRAAALNPKLAEAQLWLGIALRKAGQNKAAREAFNQSLALNPNRIWTKQQLEKTPAQ